MTKIFRQMILTTVFLILVINNCNSVENKILFKVNNEIITSLDILHELKYLQTINKEFQNIKKKRHFKFQKIL
jgi:peptidyl-prolyl cis-trans isomerase SurA